MWISSFPNSIHFRHYPFCILGTCARNLVDSRRAGLSGHSILAVLVNVSNIPTEQVKEMLLTLAPLEKRGINKTKGEIFTEALYSH